MTKPLSKREKEIMDILWNSSTPLTASEIISQNNELKMPTVQAVLKKLLNENFVVVADIGYSGTVLSRRYKAIITADEYANTQYASLSKSLSTTQLFSALPGSTKPSLEEITEIEKILSDYTDSIK